MKDIDDKYMQKLIDELIEFLLKETERPDWLNEKEVLDCITYEIATRWITTISQIDIIEMIENEMEWLENQTDEKKISIIADIINEDDDICHSSICKVMHSDERIFYIPVNCCFHEKELVYEIDSSLGHIINRYTQILRPNTTNHDGSPLNDAEILALYDKARINYEGHMNERH